MNKKFFINNFLFISWSYFNILTFLLKEILTCNILMISYVSYLSFYKIILNNFCCYYSRSKNFFWFKGLKSKNFQILKSFHLDCDMDILIINILQYYKISCHTDYFFCNINRILKI